jgi:uncharacterized repeat protein (TIGR04076 family)
MRIGQPQPVKREKRFMREYTGTKVRIEIVDILGAGSCPSGHAIGDTWLIEDYELPSGMCMFAYYAMYPFLTALMFGARFPWSGEQVKSVPCGDAANPVIYKLTPVD